MLTFKPNFKFSRLKFWGDPRPSWDVRSALGSLGQSLARLKISGRSTLKGR